MSSSSNKRAPTTATQRLKQDYLRIKKDPVPYICAEPLPSNILEWWGMGSGDGKLGWELRMGEGIWDRDWNWGWRLGVGIEDGVGIGVEDWGWGIGMGMRGG